MLNMALKLKLSQRLIYNGYTNQFISNKNSLQRARFSPRKIRHRTTERNNPPPRWASNWWRPRHSFLLPLFLLCSFRNLTRAFTRGKRSQPLPGLLVGDLSSLLKPGQSRFRHLLRERANPWTLPSRRRLPRAQKWTE